AGDEVRPGALLLVRHAVLLGCQESLTSPVSRTADIMSRVLDMIAREDDADRPGRGRPGGVVRPGRAGAPAGQTTAPSVRSPARGRTGFFSGGVGAAGGHLRCSR